MDKVCGNAWAVPPSPLMREHNNNYYTCSVCGEKVEPAEANQITQATASEGDDLYNLLREELDDLADVASIYGDEQQRTLAKKRKVLGLVHTYAPNQSR